MVVYTVSCGEGETYRIKKIFMSKELAEKHCKDGCFIERLELEDDKILINKEVSGE